MLQPTMKVFTTYLLSFLLVSWHYTDKCNAWSPSLNYYQHEKATRQRSWTRVGSTTSTTTPTIEESSSVAQGTQNNNSEKTWYRQKNKLRRYTEQALRGNRRVAVWDAVKLVQDWSDDDHPFPTRSYNAVLKALKAWAAENPKKNWKAAVQACEQIIQDMEQRQVADVVSYTTFLSTLAIHRGTTVAARRATQLLADLPVTPNSRTYNAILYAWINAGDVQQARTLFEQWHDDPHIASKLTAVSYALLYVNNAMCLLCAFA
jgi:pentatricopeptide repeat protein